MSQTIGYARVSAVDQNPQLQLDALAAAGCDRIFTEKASGALKERPQLKACLDYIREGDVLVVYKLDRLGRSLVNLVETMNLLAERKIAFRSLSENIDTTTPTGKLMFHIFAAIAEFERDVIRERAAAGRAAAKARGETGGRPLLVTSDKVDAARMLVAGGASLRQAAKTLGVSKSALHRHLVPEPGSGQRHASESAGQGSGTGKADKYGPDRSTVHVYGR
jgi:DNA invertase Pin-like site-specific DNA recombinase